MFLAPRHHIQVPPGVEEDGEERPQLGPTVFCGWSPLMSTQWLCTSRPKFRPA